MWNGNTSHQGGSDSEVEHIPLCVTQLLEVVLVALDHPRWSAVECDRARSRSWQVFLYHLLGDKPLSSLPIFWRAVQRIPKLEPIRVRFLIGIEHVAHQDVVFRFIAENER